MIKQPSNSLQNAVAKRVIAKLSEVYPQAVFYPVKAKLHYHAKELKNKPDELRIWLQILKTCKDKLRLRNAKVLEAIETLILELQGVFNNLDENFSHVLQRVVISEFYNR